MYDEDDGGLGSSWYTKYRPKTLGEYCGDTVKTYVENRFARPEDRPHTVYIAGPRGTGKTTIARILTKYYHCENPNPDGSPCEKCSMCESINDILIAGDSSVECTGVTEIDATTTNTKSKIQEVLSEALERPIYSKYKILIFDECHRITSDAQNSLLKTIEDIPPHLVCIFCTTEDEKVLATIKSRMQVKIPAQRQNIKQFAERLKQISLMEKLTISNEALEIIVKKEDRIPRECINALENIAKSNNYNVSIDTVKEYYGGDTSEIYLEYFKSANNSLADVMLTLKKIRERFRNYTEFTNGLYEFVVDALYIKHGIDTDDYTTEYVKLIKGLFKIYTTSDFDMLLQIMEHLSLNMAPDNDRKNEILLINTALRIGKINLLANGLAMEQNKMVEENKISLEEHIKRVQHTSTDITEQLKMSLTVQDLAETIGDIERVEDKELSLISSTLPELKPIETNTSKNSSSSDSAEKFCDELQDFLNS